MTGQDRSRRAELPQVPMNDPEQLQHGSAHQHFDELSMRGLLLRRPRLERRKGSRPWSWVLGRMLAPRRFPLSGLLGELRQPKLCRLRKKPCKWRPG